MATWVTHLMIADHVLHQFPKLDRHGFCVGNIAPDCNIENEDWSSFTPSREITHWMHGNRKAASDCDAFADVYIHSQKDKITSDEQYAFYLGYYAHLITDAAFQAMIRNDKRVSNAWSRIRRHKTYSSSIEGMSESWDSVKRLIPKEERMQEIYHLEAEYLSNYPSSGYLTDILPLREFPDYIDYLPHGSIVRKIGVMGYLPQLSKTTPEFIAISREEYASFISDTSELVCLKMKETYQEKFSHNIQRW